MGKQYTAEELTERWEAVREIENLMGRRAFYTMLGENDKVWNEYWCSQALEPSLGVNEGYYRGCEALEQYYGALHDYITLQTELAQKAYPDALGSRDPEEIYNVGNLVCPSISTPLIELAEDGQTAKGLWYVRGVDLGFGPSGPESWHFMGRLAADFIMEDGAWKIWHLLYAEDLRSPTGRSWSTPAEEMPTDPRFAALAEFRFPAPNVPQPLHELYHDRRPLKPFPRLPEPYTTFAETFSYGI